MIPNSRRAAFSAGPAPSSVPTRGFTVVELIVVVGVIAVLIGLLAPVLSSSRSAARLVDELSAARQLMVGFTAYASTNEDWVLPGYLPGLPAFDETRTPIENPVITARYPWRLAPYLDYNFRGLYKNSQEDLLEQMQQTDRENYIYVVSLSPSLGYNATWIGGNKNQLGFSSTALKTFGPFYITRAAQPRDPSNLIVFCSARGIDPLQPAAHPVDGYFEVRSPRFTTTGGMLWPEHYDPTAAPSETGFVSPRYNGEAAVAMFDGRTESLDYKQLLDMRHWADRATKPDYGLAPLGSH